MKIIYAEKYVSPRERPLTPAEQEVRRISYALKQPNDEANLLASTALAPLVDSHAYPGAVIILMPVPSSTNTTQVNWIFANRLAEQIKAISSRRVFVMETVARRHPVQSSCVRRRHGLLGLTVEEHAMIRIAGPLRITNTVYYFVDNVATTGSTLEACRLALGFGDGIVYADQGRNP
ncbi:MAG: hypothetical protein WCS52_04890 [bacterium]